MPRGLAHSSPSCLRIEPWRLSQLLDLFAEDRQRNVYAGQLEVRPSPAPTTRLRGIRVARTSAILRDLSGVVYRSPLTVQLICHTVFDKWQDRKPWERLNNLF